MPTYKIEHLDQIELLVAQGTNTKETKAKLDEHLTNIGITPGRYFYLEVYTNGEVSGAMVSAEVEPDTEKGSGIQRGKLRESDYVIIEATEEEYLQSANGDKTVFNTDEYLKENNLKMKDFPVHEKIVVDGQHMVKFYIAVKHK
jgi:hypothetical protein